MGHGHHEAMSDENSEKPDPIEDIRKGLGLLFRAAKSTFDQLPTRQFEDVVLTGAREVGRAIESVTGAIDKQIFKRDGGPSKAETSSSTEPRGPADPKPEPTTEAQSDASRPPDEPKGPRVG
jgi:hypothetical protein